MRDLQDAVSLRKLPLGKPGLQSKLRKAALIRSTFRNWFVAGVLVAVSLAVSTPRFLPFARMMANSSIRLRMKRSDISLTVPMLDVWPTLEVFALGEYDFSVFEWAQIQTAIDCGAHVGSFSLWLSQRTTAQIVAVEPNPRALSFLDLNLASVRNRLTIVRAAIADRSEKRMFYDYGLTAASSLRLTRNYIRKFSVSTVTLQDLMQSSGFTSIDLLKMDVEGAENEVFQAVQLDTLQRVRTAIIECHPFAGTDVQMIIDKLLRSGMQVACEARSALPLIVAWRS